MVVRRKDRLGLDMRLDMLDHGPGDGKSVERCGSTTDFIQDNQAARCGGVQNNRRFRHLHHESRSAARQVIRRADPRKNTVDDRLAKQLSGNKRPHLSKDRKQRGFSFVGPTVAYAYMQAAGLVNDHLVSCFRYQQILNEVAYAN